MSMSDAGVGPAGHHGLANQGSDPTEFPRTVFERIEVPTSMFVDGGLPGVCVHTGVAATEWESARVKSKVGAQWLMLLLGVVPFIFLRALTIKRAQGVLPADPVELDRRWQAYRTVRRKQLRRPMVKVLIVALAASAVMGAWFFVQAGSKLVSANSE